MNLLNYEPSQALKPYIRQYSITRTCQTLTGRVLPHTSLVIAFRLNGHAYYPENPSLPIQGFAGISGLRKSARVITYTKNTEVLLVMFKETGASAFFKQPLYELFGESISLEHLFNSHKLFELEERLFHSESYPEKIALVEKFLLSLIKDNQGDKLVSAALTKIHQTHGTVRIGNLVDELYISQDAFEKRFRKNVGASPKQYAYIVRMQTAIKNYTPGGNMSSLCYDLGYFDQSHFIKDFKLFTGQTPKDYFNSCL